MEYPMILYPDAFESILTSYPTIPAAPDTPQKPTKPTKPAADSGLGCSGFLLIPAVIFLFYSFSETVLLLPAVVALVFTLIYVFSNSVDADDAINKAYESRLEDYNKNLRKYNTDIKEYEHKLEEYHSLCLTLGSHGFLNEYRLGTFKDQFQVACTPTNSETPNKSGVSEQFFLKYLSSEFGKNVLVQQKLETYKGIYFPDFVICDPNKRFYIDIEIDEPYVGSTGEPIHYYNIDQKRNIIFCSLNWMVIRFAEEQIIKQPQECCQLIKETLEEFTNLTKTNVRRFNINMVNLWSGTEAHSMAFRHYRHSYLPPHLQSKLSSETFENENIVFDNNIAGWRTRDPFEETRFIDEDDDLPF